MTTFAVLLSVIAIATTIAAHRSLDILDDLINKLRKPDNLDD